MNCLSREWHPTMRLLIGLACATAMSSSASAQVVYLHQGAGIPAVDAVTSYTGHPDQPSQPKKPVITVDVKSAGEKSADGGIAGDGESAESDTNDTPSPAIPVIHMAGDVAGVKATTIKGASGAGVVATGRNASYSELVTSGGIADSRDNAIIPASEFGSGVPLSMALSSIVPSGFTLAYASVDQNRTVNWAGGRGWRDTLVSLCSAYGYHIQWVSGNTIIVSGNASGGGSSAAPTIIMADNGATGSAVTGANNAALPDRMIPVGANARNEQIVSPVQASTSRNIQNDILDRRESLYQTRSRDGAEIVPTQRGLKNTSPGVIMTKRQADNDGDMLIPNSQSALLENMPSMSYAPKNGGEGIYYAAAGQDLYQVLCVWAGANGWKVDYRDVKMRYPIYEEVSLRGDFHSVAKTLIHSIQATPAPHPRFYNGNKTLRIYNYEAG